jgi:hypothetical protein
MSTPSSQENLVEISTGDQLRKLWIEVKIKMSDIIEINQTKNPLSLLCTNLILVFVGIRIDIRLEITKQGMNKKNVNKPKPNSIFS